MSSALKPVLLREHFVISRATGAFRRAFDVLCAAAGLLVLSPAFCAIAIAIKLDDGGAVFYAQDRVGKNFRIFRLYKFRSMIANADREGLLTSSQDTRVTRIGRFLRRHKLDELPQLFNVLKGDMQFVGARPEVEKYVKLFHAQYALILRGRPGLTDPATLAYRHEDEILSSLHLERQYIEKILPEKIRLSLEYQQHRTLLSDIRVLLGTAFPPLG
ncbi:MAG TPA: sugar transferase [Terriglobales bacterium]|nr:sugar transferase [Terriglobales bacterium]